jgi:hypothetical protein
MAATSRTPLICFSGHTLGKPGWFRRHGVFELTPHARCTLTPLRGDHSTYGPKIKAAQCCSCTEHTLRLCTIALDEVV